MPVCIGKATRLIEYFDDNKEYLATIQFGSSTSTFDIEGEITKSCDKKVQREDVIYALKYFEGEITQVPPIYSAIKVKGKKLYEYARNGEEVKITPRQVTIYNIELKNFDEGYQRAEILVSCSKGTYIRSIANDLGEKLGCLGHLIKLVRTQAGKFLLEDSVQLDDEKLESAIQNPLVAISLENITVDNSAHIKISHGMPVTINNTKIKSGDFLILVYNNNIDAIGVYDGEKVKVKKVFI